MKIKTSHLILLQGLLMLLFLLITVWFNRFSADDYLFIGELSTNSFSEIYHKLFYTWNGRWTYNFSILLFLKYYQIPHFLVVFNVLSFSLLLWSVYLVFNQFNLLYKTDFNRKETLTFSLIFCGVFFFFTHLTGQSWFWISASLAYLWSCIFFMSGLNSFIKQQPHFWNYLMVVVSGLYIGGSNEVLAILTILLISYSLFIRKHSTIKWISLFAVLISFSINYFSPGTAFRDGLTPNLPFVDLMLYVGYGSIKYLILDGYKTILPAIVFALPFYVLGATTTTNFSTKFSLKQELIKTGLFIAFVVVVNQFIVIYALGGLAPDRSTIASSLLGSLALVRFMFFFGNANKTSSVNLKPILGLIVFFLVVFNVVFFTIHYNYSKSVDERMTYIHANENTELIELKKLKNSGYLNSAEITNDTNHFLNQHLKYGLGINQQIVLRDN